MPTYLCHGFRWHRRSIRFFVIIYDLLDAAPDWIIGRGSSKALLEHFYERYEFLPRPPSPRKPSKTPIALAQSHTDERNGDKSENNDSNLTTKFDEDPVHINDEWSAVKLLEEHDPHETEQPSRPYAYVADYVVRVELSAGLTEEIARYERIAKERGNDSWFVKLRDALEKDEEIGWFVVVNGNEEDIVHQAQVEREAQATEPPILANPHIDDSIRKTKEKNLAVNHRNADELGIDKDTKRPPSRMKRLKDKVFGKGS